MVNGVFIYEVCPSLARGCSSIGRASAFQAECCGFDSRHPLHFNPKYNERVRIINNWTIIGNLTADPELRTTRNGRNVCNFSVAINEGWGETAKVTFVKVAVFGNSAESCAANLKKGRKVAIRGTASASAYINRNTNQAAATLQMNAFEVEFLTPKNAQPEDSSYDPYSPPLPDDDLTGFTDITDSDETLPF